MSATPESGVAPLQTIVPVSGSFNVSNPNILVSGPASVAILSSPNPNEHVYQLNTPGIYTFTAQAYTPDGNRYQNAVSVTVMDKTALDSLLKQEWTALKAAFKSKNINDALQGFVQQSRDKYSQIFAALIDQLPTIADTFIEFNITKVVANAAAYEIVANENGELYSYPGRFVKDDNGLWQFNDF